MLTLCGPIVKRQPEWSRWTGEKHPSAPGVWLGDCQLPIKINLKAPRHVFLLAAMLTQQTSPPKPRKKKRGAGTFDGADGFEDVNGLSILQRELKVCRRQLYT